MPMSCIVCSSGAVACQGGVVTNLDLIELLVVEGADPNAQDDFGRTPLMYTAPYAPGVAKFLLNLPTTDANITDRSGASAQVMVRFLLTTFSNEIADPERVQDQFLLQQ